MAMLHFQVWLLCFEWGVDVMKSRFVICLTTGILIEAGSARADGPPRGDVWRGSCCSWTGFYIGAHGGYGWGTLIPPSGADGGLSEISLSGGFGGLQAGYNVQVAPNWFFGVEQDI